VSVHNLVVAAAHQLTLDEASLDDGVKRVAEDVRARFGEDALGIVHTPGAQSPREEPRRG
jgi:hypothetical protein